MYDMNMSVRYVVKETGEKTTKILDKIQKIQFIAPYLPKNLEIHKICKDAIGMFFEIFEFLKADIRKFRNRWNS